MYVCRKCFLACVAYICSNRWKTMLDIFLSMLSLVASCRFVSLPFSFPRCYIPGWGLENWRGGWWWCWSGGGVNLRAFLWLYFVILRLKRVTENQHVTTVLVTRSRSYVTILASALPCNHRIPTGRILGMIFLPFLTCHL